eukprot:TRINITY_DN66612_c0_g1_i1.p1 TRINITY_DN66612_c0_g1~~TRINITY_DN66612_c0_g1_i1.p1  ORF type:complete len:285 (-),score=43.27 TRINITY_DN66612_c0_g1_i1:260-1114(-)
MVLTFLHVPEAQLYKSEPPPEWFGNPGNEANAGWTNKNWLKSRFHFSFAEYRNPKNSQFGVLRVMNDDLVQGSRGFGTHPHRDMEIVTYIVEGELTHADSINRGQPQTLGRGSVQFMTAGTGIQHSEHNRQNAPLRFIQIWITPRDSGYKPTYGGYDGATSAAVAARKNALSQLVGDAQSKTCCAPVKLQQDLSMYVADLDIGSQVTLPLAAGRQAYVLCVEGKVALSDASSGAVNPVQLVRHDAAEVRCGQGGGGEICLAAPADSSAHVLVLEMAHGPGGRSP